MKISITHLGNSHSDWLRSLDFYKHELGILKQRLTEVAGKNSGHEVMAKVEHFENQFMVQQENIDQLSHDIRVNLDAISKAAEESAAGYIEGDLVTKHNSFGQKFKDEEKVINDLRHEFNEFASVWM